MEFLEAGTNAPVSTPAFVKEAVPPESNLHERHNLNQQVLSESVGTHISQVRGYETYQFVPHEPRRCSTADSGGSQ